MVQIDWTNGHGFMSVGTLNGHRVASVTMREPGAYVAATKNEHRWFETEAEAFAWCEENALVEGHGDG